MKEALVGSAVSEGVTCPGCLEALAEKVENALTSRNHLDTMAEQWNVVRMPGESDYNFRRRIRSAVEL